MDEQHVVADGLWTTDDRFKRAVEVRLDSDQDSGIGGIPASELTSLQVFGWNSGAPLSGQVLFGPERLRELHEVIGRRLAELEGGHQVAASEKGRWGVVPSRGAKVVWSDQGGNGRYSKSWCDVDNQTQYDSFGVIELTNAERMTLTLDNVKDVAEFVGRSGHEADFYRSPDVPCRVTVALGKEGAIHIAEGDTVYRLDKSRMGQNDQYFVQRADQTSFPYAWEGRNFTELPFYNLTGGELA